MFAVVKMGGKQYRIAANDIIRVEKISAEPGDIVELADVLLFSGENGVEFGNPRVEGVTVSAEVLGQEKAGTVIIFKKRRRHHYRRRNGHRQALTALKITEILTGGRKPQARRKQVQAAPVEKAPPSETEKIAEAAAPAAKAPARRAKKPGGEAKTKPKSTGKSKPKAK
jgi:large subunit ribosomal protein L21